MKKALVGAALLGAAAGLVGAQDTGLQFSGDVRSGLRADFLKVGDNIKSTDSPEPNISVWHDDSGPVRATLTGKYTGEEGNYGVVFNLRGKWNEPKGVYFDMPNAYGWFNALGGMLKFTGGRIDDSAWAQIGTDDYNYSQGDGLRVEVKPIEGLNFGFILRAGDITEANSWAGKGASYLARRFLKETGFGASFDNDMLKFRAGFTLDSNGDGVRGKTVFDDFKVPGYSASDYFGLQNALQNILWASLTKQEQDAAVAAIYDQYGSGFTLARGVAGGESFVENDGASAYVGVGLGPAIVEGLTFDVAAQFGNLGEFSKLGWVWIDERIRFALNEQLTVGLDAHQIIWGGDWYGKPGDSLHGSWNAKDADASAPVYLEFNPQVSFKLSDKMTVGLEIPIRHWTDYVDIAIGAKPKVGYQFGKNFGLNGYYRFDYFGIAEKSGLAADKDGLTSDSIIKNSIQLSFEWSF